MIRDTINSIDQVDLNSIDYPDIDWKDGLFHCNTTGSGRNKVRHPWSGVATNIGEVEVTAWCEIAEALIARKGESHLLECLIEWESEHNYTRASRADVKKEALQLHIGRYFDRPLWVGFVPFNRKYRPEALNSARLVTVVTDCCNVPGEVTQEQIDHAWYGTISCPCCGRWSPFHRIEGENI